MLSNVLLTILAVFAAHAVYAQDVPVLAATDVLSFVDALIGTANGGHVFAGAVSRFIPTNTKHIESL